MWLPSPTSAYTRTVSSRAQRLIGFAMVLSLSGSSALLSACMVWCIASPVAVHAAAQEATGLGGKAGVHRYRSLTDHSHSSEHAHHGAATASSTNSPQLSDSQVPSPDARLVGGCDGCCSAASMPLLVGPEVERIDGKTTLLASTVALARGDGRFELSRLPLNSHFESWPPPARAPLPLRI